MLVVEAEALLCKVCASPLSHLIDLCLDLIFGVYLPSVQTSLLHSLPKSQIISLYILQLQLDHLLTVILIVPECAYLFFIFNLFCKV